jgi:hypothetical protein
VLNLASRRWLWLCIVALIAAAAGWCLPRAALAQESGITSPSTGASIGGDVPVMGTAVIEPFQKYELHYKLEPSNDDAYIYFTGATTPVVNGQLGVWQAGGLPPGVYSLRLRVVKNDGNYAEYFAKNLSVNPSSSAAAAPTATPTPGEPTPTPIPTATFTPAPQPTPAVGAVAQPAIEEPATPTPEAVAVVPAPAADQPAAGSPDAVGGVAPAAGADADSSLTRELGEALSLNRLRAQFFNGMRFSAALFLGLLALYGGKRLFDWVWTQFT